MPDLEALDGVAAASIEAVNGVAKANIEAINGTSVPAAATGASRFVVAAYPSTIVHASVSDLTSWSSYEAIPSTSRRPWDIGFGKDNSGNGIYIATFDNDDELAVSGTDVTATDAWTDVDLSSDLSGDRDQNIIMWGARADGTAAGTWMSGGKQTGKRIHRSIDGGANWTNIDLSGVSGHDTARNIVCMASDGSGNWAFGQENRWYSSTNDGASFSATTPISSNAPGQTRGVVYTNSSWVWIYSRSSQLFARSCADSDITDWGDEFTIQLTYNKDAADGTGTETDGTNTTLLPLNPDNTIEKRASTAAANGLVMLCTSNDDAVFFFNVSGKTLSNAGGVRFSSHSTYDGVSGFDASNTMQDIATDGTNWVITCKNGDAFKSTSLGALGSWTQIANGFAGGVSAATDDWYGVTCDVVLPL
jgi:hypothetical protein